MDYLTTHLPPRRKCVMLTIVGILHFLAGVSFSLQAPFYPAEAQSKGVSATEYGMVFGVFELAIIVVSPIVGKYVSRVGPKNVFCGSILLTSLAFAWFGTLHWIQDRWTFFSLSFACRIVEGIGCAALFTVSFVIIAWEFPDSVGTTLASLETLVGLGTIVGPTLGGALYELGGFPVPFTALAGFLFALSISAAIIMPKIVQTEEEKASEEPGIISILKIIPIFLAGMSTVSTQIAIGYVVATLEPHIRPFQLSPILVGTVFVTEGLTYTLTAPLWGYICDKIRDPLYVTLLGNIFIFTGAIFIGPASFIPLDTQLWITVLGLVIQGLGTGCCFVSTFIVGIKESTKHGLPDNLSTSGLVSGLIQSLMSVGVMVGSIGGGVLFDKVGFRKGSFLVLLPSAVSMVLTFLYLTMHKTNKIEGREETTPLLSSI